MHKQCTGSSLIFWLPVLCLALGPTASAVDDEAPALEPSALESPAALPSNAASLIPANTPPTLKALGGAVRPGGHLVLAAYATDADSSLVQVLAALHLRPGQPAPAWLGQTRWASPLAPFPLLEIAVSPPADAVPETYVIEVSATDDGGLSALGEMLLEVLPPETPAVPPPAPSPAGAQGASSSSAAAVGGASSGAAGAAAAKAATSSSSESPSLSLSVSPASVAEGSIRDIVVTGTLMGVSMVPGVDVTGVLQVSGTATDGTDYSLSGTKSLVIPAGSATLTGTRTLRLSALGDVRERESDETVKFKVTQVTRGTEVLALSSAAKTSVTITNVYAKPPKVSGVTAQTASDSSLKVAWEAPEASPPVTKYIVQYRRDDKPEKQWARAAEVSGEVLEALATGLHSGRRYDVQVRAKNGAGKGAWSDEATANTAPKVTLEAADGGVASIREGNASVGVALTGWAKAQGGGGTLTGQWLQVTGSGSSETETAWGSSFTMASKRDYEKTARSDAPETRKYRLRVTHDLSGERATVDRDATVTWLPKVLLSASPSSVPEDGGARTVTVEAKLTGRTVSAASKSVRVNVKGDTATEGTDFAAVSSFTISIPGGDRSATGTFELSPVADSSSEGGETVKLKGSATEGDQELKARNGEVTIEDEQVTLTVSPTPANGSVTGTGIACGTGTAGDCSESVTKSTPLTLAASPASGWAFKEWSGACSEDEDASCALTVSGATTVGASFRRPKVKVKVSPAAGGSVTGTGISCGAGTTNDCSERVSTGSIALTAAPASGYAVSSWSGGNCTGKGTTCTATVTADVTVTVTFAEGSVPAAPSGLSAAPGDGSVALSWTDPGDASITGYEIRRKAGSGAYGSWSDISGSGANTTSHSVTGLTNGTAYSFELRAENASGSGDSAEVSATPSRVPTADAGDDQSVAKGAAVTLDGSGSSDPGGSTLTYAWSQTGGTTVALSSATSASPTFTAPNADGTLTFSLTVTNPQGLTGTDTATVTVENQAPISSVADQSVAKGSTVTLDGSGSSDPEGGALTYAWNQTGGTTVALSSATSASPTFTAPSADGALTFSLTVTDPQGLTGTDTATVTVENQAPMAEVPDQSVAKGSMVTLDGSGSSDPEGGALTYAWSQTGGTTVALSSATSASPTFTAPSADGALTFSLTVTDPQGLTGTDTATVTVENQAPMAEVPDQSVAKGSMVTLDGSGSSDPEGGALTYAWSQTGGTTVSLSSATSASPTFTAPSADGALTFSLTVTDPQGLTGTDTATVTVENQAPMAEVPDQSVAKGSMVTLDGSGSSDPEGGALTYAWSQTGGTTVALSSATSASPTFTAPSADGALTFSLTVADPQGLTGTDTATVTVENQAPMAEVPDQSVAKGSMVTLDGSGSSDPEGGALTYAWSQTGGTTVSLSSATSASPTFTAPSADGALTFSLTVADPQGLTGTDTATVTVENQAPMAEVPDQSVAKGSRVTLDGSGSSDPEGGALTYAWSQTGGTTVSLSSATSASPTFTAPNADGALTFSLTVADPQGLTGTDTATVTVENQAPMAEVPDQSVAKGSRVTLDGSGSSDPEGGALTYAWSQTGGTTVSLSSATSASPTFTAPNADGALTFSLTVADPQGLTGTDTATVTVENQAPMAEVPDQSVAKGSRVTLDGSGSSDPEGGALTYAWSQTGGTTVALSSTTAASPTFTAPNADGALTFSLTVADPQGLTGTDTATVTVENQAPMAEVPDQSVAKGSRVTLDGSGSSDPEGGALTYAWSQTGGTTVALSSTTAAKPRFTAPSADGTLTFSLTVADPQGLTGTDSVTVTVENQPPTANAGPDQSVAKGSRVTLDGSGSADPEGGALTYAWSQTGGTTVTLRSATSAKPRFTAPSADGTLTFSLTVADPQGLTGTDSVTVAVENQPPTADAGDDQSVAKGSEVTLDGSGSSDPEGGALTYAWSQTGGTTVTLRSATSAKPRFTAPSADGTLTFSLTVADPQGLTGTDSVTVAVENQPPTADAGDDQSVAKGSEVTLDGSGSSDPEGGALTYAWSQTGGTTVTLRSATSAKPTFTAPSADGTLTFSLTVADPQGLTGTDSVTVAVENQPPTADAGDDQSVAKGSEVTLDGSGSSDPEGGALTYAWSQTGGTTVTLRSATSAKPTFTAPSADGTLTFSLTVADPQGLTGTDSVTVAVENQPPTADAGDDQSVAKGSEVTLDGSGSSDPEGGALTYAWSQTGGTTVTLRSATSAKPTFTAPSADGTLTFSLTVADPQGLTGTDSVTVAVENQPPTADAGDDQSVAQGSEVTLDGSGSSDPEGSTLTYAWSQTAGTTVTLRSATSVKPTFTAPGADGTLTFSLTVTDTENSSDTDSTTVTVRSRLTVDRKPDDGGTVAGIKVGSTTEIINCGTDCSELVDSSDEVKLTATAASSHLFESWTGCVSDSENVNVCTKTVEGNVTVTANFAKPKLKIDPKPANGYVTGNGISCGSGTGRTTCEVSLNRGTAVSLSTTADMNYWFKGWIGGPCDGTVGACAFQLSGNTTFGADFQPYDFIYRLASSKPATPTGGTANEQHTPTGWQRTKPSPTAGQPVWWAQRKRHYNDEGFASATAWSGVAKIEDLDFIYNETTSAPATPTGGETVETHTPSGWTRAPRNILNQNVATFQAERVRHYKNGRFARASAWGGVVELFSVNAGGPYWADPVWWGRSSHYSAFVEATARGGVSPLSYRWEGKSTNSRSATYLFETSGIYSKSVTVTDGSGEKRTSSATIFTRGQLRIGGASDDFAHEVPLGGTLVFIWGGAGSVSATSDDAGIATVSVSGAEIVVSGVSAGRTEIAVKPAGSEFRMPIRVGEGE